MEVQSFFSLLKELGADFYTGVPDSLLSPFIDALPENHIVAANEGAAVGLAAGHYLATGQAAVVYMQNSGIGNALNPICSLLHSKVYAIPLIFVIGWRGEPGTKDEPQHVFQGECTLGLLECLEIPYAVVPDNMAKADSFKNHLQNGQSVAFVVRKNALINPVKRMYTSEATLSREDALKTILSITGERAVHVCTTGKLSREVFEIREERNQGHGQDFLTVGSMGHSISIAHGIAIAKPEKQVFCLDGDGAALMHMGSLAVIGVHSPKNLVHVVINNGAHETVGGLPTVCGKLRLCEVAKSLGYKEIFHIVSQEELERVIITSINKGPIFIEVICNLESRANLGRPTTTTIQNKNDFMKELSK